MSSSGHRENDWQRICLSAFIWSTYTKKGPLDKTRSMLSPNNKRTGIISAYKCAYILLLVLVLLLLLFL